ncbi:MAG: aminotransferase class I/II-fold pyridoxal phosphate-dependent enzyme [Clostridia bacterium]|nr:aminotransferase class I/II-fold pyridoxal phosphate-dependent enzyme [Clostridia bacterium]
MNYPFRPQILREVKSYAQHTPASMDGILDCSLGENPYGCSPEAVAAVKTYDPAHLSSYPHSPVLTEAVLRYWEGKAKLTAAELTFCQGTMEGLYKLNNLFAQTERNQVVGFIPCFTDMAVSIRHYGMEFRGVRMHLEENGQAVTQDLIAAIDEKTAFLYVDRPNNPTGQVLPLADIRALLAAAQDKGSYVIVDEAYGDFIPQEESALTLWGECDNLIVLRSFSKGFGLADLRGGLIAASAEVTAILARLGNPYAIGEFGKHVFAAALGAAERPDAHMEDFAAMKSALKEACKCRLAMLETDLRAPICTLMLREPGDLQELLLQNGILTVSGVEFDALDERYVRLRVPVRAELPRLLNAIRAIEG